MNCETIRSHFSEHFDRRLKGEALGGFVDHLERCGSCSDEWERYRRVFELVRTLGDTSEARPFRRPEEPPGMIAAAFPGGGRARWTRMAAAASVLLLVGVSGVIMFKLGKGSFTAPEVEGPRSPAVVTTPVAAVPTAREIRENWRDHLDAMRVTLNQCAQIESGAELAGNALIEAKVPLLRPEGLLSTDPEDLRPLRGGAVTARAYVNLARTLLDELSDHTRRNPGRHPEVVLWRKQNEFNAFKHVWGQLWADLSGEASGRGWSREPARFAAFHNVSDPELADLLAADERYLTADYAGAQERFNTFCNANPQSSLNPIARYVQCEAQLRIGRVREARRTMRRVTAFRLLLPSPVAVLQPMPQMSRRGTYGLTFHVVRPGPRGSFQVLQIFVGPPSRRPLPQQGRPRLQRLKL